MLIEIFYFSIIFLCPFFYFYLLNYFKKILIPLKFQSVKRFHNYFFIGLQILITLSLTNFLIEQNFIFELFTAIGMIYLLFNIYGTYIYKLYWPVQDNYIYLPIIFILASPIIFMNIVRNYFDTYTIGFMIFNLSNINIFFWEIIILSLLNLNYLFSKFYRSNLPILLIVSIYYFLRLIF